MKLQGFAKFFSGYPLDEVIATIEELDQSDLEVFHKRFGTNYDNNYSKELTKEERAKLYNAVSKVKRSINKKNQVVQKEKVNLEEKISKPEMVETTRTTTDVLLEIFHDPEYVELLKKNNPLEYVVLALKLGYATGENYSTTSIAEFLKIDQSKVVEATKNGLKVYKEKLIKTIDNIAVADTAKVYEKK